MAHHSHSSNLVLLIPKFNSIQTDFTHFHGGSSSSSKKDMDDSGGEVVVVAVDASKEITDHALEWAVRNVAKAMDSLILLAIIPSIVQRKQSQGFLCRLKKKWGSGIRESCASDNTSSSIVEQDLLRRINNVCEHMMEQQLNSSDNPVQVLTEVKVVANAQLGTVAAKASQLEAKWVILDWRLRKECDFCLKQLDCNIVLIDRSAAKVIRAVDHGEQKEDSTNYAQETSETVNDMLVMNPSYHLDGDYMTPKSSFGLESPRVEKGGDDSVSVSSTDKEQSHKDKDSPLSTKSLPSNSFLHLNSQRFVDGNKAPLKPSPLSNRSHLMRRGLSLDMNDQPRKVNNYAEILKIEDMNGGYWQRPKIPNPQKHALTRRSTLPARLASKPPPICSTCNQNSPTFVKALQRFSYKEILRATDRFSARNLVSRGGDGSVYRGVLQDGQVVAVKQHNMLSAQGGADELCLEVEVLSSAQHRNLVMLVGYCIETEWLLVYEFVCNGSLDKHLYVTGTENSGSLEKHLYGTEEKKVMSWEKRMRVAVGAARGLRYLHEDCRAGCIVHGDLRPNNILLTHDFEPMVGDFGLARLQPEGVFAEESRVFSSFGYVAPESVQNGLISEKADVYAFGVILLELLSGMRAADLSRNTGHEFGAEQGSPLLNGDRINKFIDPKLEESYVKKEAECMMRAASLCISPDPEKRPKMSTVLKILEGDLPILDAPIRGPTRKLNQTRSSIKQVKPSSKHRVVRSDWDFRNTDDFLSQEFEVYLQGSLAKFIQKQE